MTPFILPPRYLGVNQIEIRPVELSALIEKPLNFIRPPVDGFRVTDLTKFGRWTPFRLIINGQSHIVLLDKAFSDNRKALDYYITILQRCVSLVCNSTDNNPAKYRLEIEDGLLIDGAPRRPQLMEFSTFCDLLNATLTYNRDKFRIVIGLLHSFGTKLQASIEYQVMKEFPRLSKNSPETHSLKNKPFDGKAPPRTAMADAFSKARMDES
ncbi:hypothetical protein NRE35_004201 [Salmonella enterica]|nr:hypothetical protein [Escherichia coli]EJO2543835.1 hypothetical protein [Salmonella enterica]ELF5188702.1 hypothetical protein [Salmonella enterica]